MARKIDEGMPTEALPKVAEKDLAALFGAMESLESKKVPFKGMIYGDPGTAKTTQALELAQNMRTDPKDWILYFDTAQGWTSLQNRPELMQNVKRVSFENMESLRLYAAYAKNPHPQIQEVFKHMVCVVFDEYTNMVDRDLHWIVRERSKQAEKKGEFKDPHNPALPDYLSQKVRSGEVLNDYMDLDCHVIFIGHAKVEEKTGVIGPDIPNKASSELVRLLHGLYYATVKEEGEKSEFTLMLDQRGNAKRPYKQAKNRIGGLAGSFATMSQVIEAYNKWGITDTPVGEEKEETVQIESTEPTESVTPDNIDNLLD